jgi:hypothetical protein
VHFIEKHLGASAPQTGRCNTYAEGLMGPYVGVILGDPMSKALIAEFPALLHDPSKSSGRVIQQP